ncbi:hypothetical protein RFM99_29905 [Mesorhizobium sp. VK4C]|uniref:hypothetical protein n=1 Tax=Mesorhizobium captivum TaxID=3072319 RepID=UPI002A23A828|nr:hypothetical protein [Mesorhizobium sp. VK4C]MDX8502599.1 hypothetical protein [Mesorhizobium sp. VK4C]
MERITPKFLTPSLAEMAVSMVLDAFMFNHRMDGIIGARMCHVVILVPSIVPDDNEWAHGLVTPTCIYETSRGNREDWSHEFDRLARNKALQLWREQRVAGNTDPAPHLLFSGDTPFWGGVKRHGIAVAVSGPQSFFDEMLAGMIADAIKGLASFYFEQSADKKEKRSYLS